MMIAVLEQERLEVKLNVPRTDGVRSMMRRARHAPATAPQ
eukprot:COSAG01_NODE_7876_length_3012_cov_22.085479_5_plen_40_part_00